MKKFIALTIGLSFLGAALLIPMSEASREAYHSYLTKKIKESGRYRHYSERKGNPKQALVPRKVAVKKSIDMYAKRSHSKNLLFPSVGKRNLYKSFSSNKNLKKRTVSNRIVGREMGYKTSPRTTISANKNLDTKDFSFKNYSNDIFSIEVPTTIVNEYQNNYFEGKIPSSSIIMTVKKLDTKCQNEKVFPSCARSISKTLDRSGTIYRSSETVQRFYKTDTILGELGLNNKKFVEGFIGVNKGNSSFIARSIIEGKNGDIFLVETTSNIKDIDKAVVFAKRFFGTFRAKY